MENNKTRAEHVDAWKASGLNRKQYALAEGINYGTFKGWVYEREKNPKKIEWKPIKVKEDAKEDQEETKSFFELRIGGKWRFELDMRIRL